ncbi:MAG: hypothetical protein J0M33_10070 [Anaerolineae bacterium]|nr:hypothetical protein [Anaerolineae bacterium]
MTFTIPISDRLYEKAQRIAAQTAQSVDHVIEMGLADAFDQPLIDLPADERAELRALEYLSDDALWTMAREQLQAVKQARLSTLMDKHSGGTISATELEELTQLVEDGDRLTLRKATAMKLLMKRGHRIALADETQIEFRLDLAVKVILGNKIV